MKSSNVASFSNASALSDAELDNVVGGGAGQRIPTKVQGAPSGANGSNGPTPGADEMKFMKTYLSTLGGLMGLPV